MSRVFTGCRALMAAAAKGGSGTKSAAATTAAAPAAKAAAAKATAAKAAASGRTSGLLKTTPVSPALGKFLGASEASRSGAVKKIWDYIKANNLQKSTDKRVICCDDKLKTIFEGKESIGMLEISRYLNRHFVKAEEHS